MSRSPSPRTEPEAGTPTRRVVVVYERAGQGHRAAAEVLAEILGDEAGVQVVLVDATELEGGSEADAPNPFVRLWNLAIRRGWFGLADLTINHVFRVGVFPFMVVFLGPRVRDRAMALAPDAIVSTADVYSRALGDAAIRLGVPFTVVPTETSVFADLLHPGAEYLCTFADVAEAIGRFDTSTPYFRTAVDELRGVRASARYLARWFRTYGIRRASPLLYQSAGGPGPRRNHMPCHVIGPLRRAADHAPPGTPPDRTRVLVASGSLGGRFVTGWVDQLLGSGLRGTVTALCGRDGRSRAALMARSAPPGLELDVRGYADDLPSLLRSASVLVARPSANLLIEAILAGLPVLIPSRCTLNDAGSATLVRRWGIGEVYDRDADRLPLLMRMLGDLAPYRARLEELLGAFPRDRDGVAEQVRRVVWRRSAR